MALELTSGQVLGQQEGVAPRQVMPGKGARSWCQTKGSATTSSCRASAGTAAARGHQEETQEEARRQINLLSFLSQLCF